MNQPRAIFLRKRHIDWPHLFNIFFVVLLLVAAQFAICGLCFYIGGEWAVERAKAEASKIAAARRVEPAVNPPAQLLKCDQAGREEFLRVCRARLRSTEVGK